MRRSAESGVAGLEVDGCTTDNAREWEQKPEESSYNHTQHSAVAHNQGGSHCVCAYVPMFMMRLASSVL